MNFKLATCPKCKKKHLLEANICGTPCGCGTYLHDNDKQNIKEIKKQQVESADAFSRNFDEFEEHLKREEKRWNESNRFVEFKTVSIPNKKLLELVK